MDKDQIPNIIVQTTYVFMGLFAMLLLITSAYVKDTSFITAHPYKFIIETLVVTIGTSLAFIYGFKMSRGFKARNNIKLLSVMAFKIFIIHILLEFSGVYTFMFKDIPE